MKCYSCNVEVITDEYLRAHLKAQRILERRLGETDPRARIMLAMLGQDHDQVMPDVSRRAVHR